MNEETKNDVLEINENDENVLEITAETEESAEAVSEELPTEETSEPAENPEVEVPKEEKSVQEEFISEFAPAPIKIPNYNKEKEKKKVQKANAKKRKMKSKKARRRKRIIRKILIAARNVMFVVLLIAIAFMTISSLIVRLNTTEYSVENAVRKGNPETFVVGKIKSPEKLNLKLSSSKASIADVLRDNSLLLVTYADIKNAVSRSSYPTFVSEVASDVINYYVYGESFEKVTAADISEVLYKNASYIKIVTGIEPAKSSCDEMGGYIVNSATIKELAPEKLALQDAAKYTPVTKVLFSSAVLIALVVALILLLVLVVCFCKGYWHTIAGVSITVAGLAAGVLGYLFKPSFVASSPFAESVLSAIVKSFNQSAAVYGVVAILIGVLVILIGKALGDEDEYEED